MNPERQFQRMAACRLMFTVSNFASFHEDFFFGSFDRVAVRATEAVLDLRAIRRES
jgi:hypothetical protein